MESFATVAPAGVETADFDLAVIEPDYTLRTRLAVELADAAQFETIEELVQKLTGGRPVVAVFGPGFVSPWASSTCTGSPARTPRSARCSR